MSTVSTAYQHVSKAIEPAPVIALGESVLKWYDIAPWDEPVPPAVRVLARGTLRAAAESREIEIDDDLGFVILHRCGAGFYFLIVCTWRNENELWSTVLAKDGEDEHAFRRWPIDGPHRPTFCVWELGAVWHEQQAWSRYLRSERDAADRQAYLRDTYRGDV